jgi:hypothetical protein
MKAKKLYRIPEYKFVHSMMPTHSMAAVRLFIDPKLPRSAKFLWRDPATGDYLFETRKQESQNRTIYITTV